MLCDSECTSHRQTQGTQKREKPAHQAKHTGPPTQATTKLVTPFISALQHPQNTPKKTPPSPPETPQKPPQNPLLPPPPFSHPSSLPFLPSLLPLPPFLPSPPPPFSLPPLSLSPFPSPCEAPATPKLQREKRKERNCEALKCPRIGLSGCRVKPRRGFTRPGTPNVNILGPRRFRHPKRGKKERKLWREREKKEQNFGPPHPSGPHFLGSGHHPPSLGPVMPSSPSSPSLLSSPTIVIMITITKIIFSIIIIIIVVLMIIIASIIAIYFGLFLKKNWPE